MCLALSGSAECRLIPPHVWHTGPLKCSLHWLGRGFTAPTVRMYCKIYQAFQLIITAHAIKSPIVIYNPQISRSKLTRLEMEKKNTKITSKWRMEHRSVKGSAHGYVRLLREPEPQSRSPRSYNSPMHQTYNTCKSFPLCSPPFPSPTSLPPSQPQESIS